MATFTQEQVQTSLKARIEAWQNGEIQWKVHNQFEETTLESALEQLNEETLAKLNENYADADESFVTTLDIAHFLSSFEEPELDSAWIN